jgi:hypothetical protein
VILSSLSNPESPTWYLAFSWFGQDWFSDCRIGNYQEMFFIFMLEKIEHALLFHQSGNKIEVGLMILNTVFLRIIRAGDIQLIVLELLVVKNLFNDIRNGFILEYPGVGRARQHPERRHHGCRVTGELWSFRSFFRLAAFWENREIMPWKKRSLPSWSLTLDRDAFTD